MCAYLFSFALRQGEYRRQPRQPLTLTYGRRSMCDKYPLARVARAVGAVATAIEVKVSSIF